MAERTNAYPNVTRDQLRKIQHAILDQGIVIRTAPPPSLHSQPYDSGSFETNGYSINYQYLPNDSTGTTGTLLVQISGSLLFIGKAVDKLDERILPYLT